MSGEQFAALLMNGQENVTIEDVDKLKSVGIFGRVCNYPNKECISTTLANIETRRIQFIMDSNALIENFLGKTTEETLRSLGWAKHQIEEKKMKRDWIFELLLFPQDSLDDVHLATWSNIKILVVKNYPLLQEIVVKFWDEMSTKTLADLEEMHGESFEKSKFSYMELSEKIEAIGIENITMTDLRHFCYCDIGLKALFSGDGFSYDYHGNKTNVEYVTSNKKRSDIKELQIIRLKSLYPL